MTEGTAVVLGGAGAVGELFVRLLGAHVPTTVVDRTSSPIAPTVIGDVCDPSPEVLDAVRTADTVVIALPEDVALHALSACAHAFRAGCLVVDTLSVKHAVAVTLARIAAERGVEALSLNPMFAPALGFRGHAVAAVPVVPGPRAAWLLELITAVGARPVELTAEEHDLVTAVAQAATHAAVLALGRVAAELGGGIDRLGELAPPPHRALLALLARITGANPDVYWDVQAGNPAAAKARAALAAALTDLDSLVAADDREGFSRLLGDLGTWLGPRGDDLRAQAIRQLEALRPSTG
ncbi:prephenate dehydrogenase/arogenate dehydrogenase family protein [Saccharothrix deserti]|uniref:prephenate dehydrogenase/arogenate dehydrogenase family protein n=1 Tax=Saccharothrix deserti TaxID=2593674 RepID=UPI00131E1D27|nr:prephenate dehydrogenase/arogenate dehydrogenase family protein [Saccharothrix deserti]